MALCARYICWVRQAEAGRALPLDGEARTALIAMADGDGRYLLNLAEELFALPEAALLDTQGLVAVVQKRAPLYAKIQQMIVDDQPEIFGMMRERRIVYRDWVKGFEYSPVRMTEEVDLYPLYIE